MTSQNYRAKSESITSFRNWIVLAQYEADIDPYHGIFDTNHDHIFMKCSKTFSLLQKKNHDNQISLFANVQYKYGITCPFLQQGMKQYIDRSMVSPKKSSKKMKGNKRKGSNVQDEEEHGTFNPFRNPDSSLICECDYNPLCSVSLGGVMDEYLNVYVRDMSVYFASGTDSKEKLKLLGKNVSNTKSCWIEKLNDQRFKQFTKSVSLRKTKKITLCLIEEHLREYVLNDDDDLSEKMSLIQKFHRQSQENPETCKNDEFGFTSKVGMNNLGSTCYLNSYIQCFTANLGVTQGLFSIKFTKEEKQNVTSIPAFLELKSTLLKLVFGYSSVLDTNSLCKAFKIPFNVQKDPDEFEVKFLDQMKYLLDSLRLYQKKITLSKKVIGYLKKETSDILCKAFKIPAIGQDDPDEFLKGKLLDQMNCLFKSLTLNQHHRSNDQKNLHTESFYGTVIEIKQCLKCNYVSELKEDCFQNLLLPLTSGTTTYTLHSLLRDYFSPEKIDFKCNKCKDGLKATSCKKIGISPNILNITIKRTTFNSKTMKMGKSLRKVLIPSKLNLKTYEYKNKEKENNEYVLYAYLLHDGKTMYEGHYTAVVMDWLTGRWSEFDDHKVKYTQHPKFTYADEPEEPKKNSGSSMIYKCFYVKQSFLKEKVRTQLDMIKDGDIDKIYNDNPRILQKKSK